MLCILCILPNLPKFTICFYTFGSFALKGLQLCLGNRASWAIIPNRRVAAALRHSQWYWWSHQQDLCDCDLAKWWKLAAIPLLHCDLFFLWTGSLAFSCGPKCALWSSIRTSPQLLLVLHAPWPSVQVLQAANAVLRSESESNRRKLRALKFCAEMVAELLSLCSVSSNFLFAEHFYGHFVEAWDVEEDGLWSLQLTTLFKNLKEYIRCYWDSCCRDVSSLLWQPVHDTLLGLYFMNNWKYYHKMLLRDSNIGISLWNVQYPVNIPSIWYSCWTLQASELAGARSATLSCGLRGSM